MKSLGIALAASLFLAATPAAAQAPNDAQIASIVVTANQVDIDAGKVAQSKGSNAEVKAFGKQMVTDHTAVNKQAAALARRSSSSSRRTIPPARALNRAARKT